MDQHNSNSNSMNDDNAHAVKDSNTNDDNDNDDVSKELSNMTIDSRSEKKKGTCLY